MSKLKQLITEVNDNGKKVLSVFVTAGFPTLEATIEICSGIYDSGADIIELGIPFSDPLADGPVIQKASQLALANGVTMQFIFKTVSCLKQKYPSKGLVLMGYANPIFKYGIAKFYDECVKSGVDGLIVPDIPLEEYETFYTAEMINIDKILLTTPVSPADRIEEIDNKSSGFVYCVSVLGTTGTRDSFDTDTLKNLARTRDLLKKNKMLIGFGISSADNIRKFYPYCDGFIVGSTVIKAIEEDSEEKNSDWKNTVELIRELDKATYL